MSRFGEALDRYITGNYGEDNYVEEQEDEPMIMCKKHKLFYLPEVGCSFCKKEKEEKK